MNCPICSKKLETKSKLYQHHFYCATKDCGTIHYEYNVISGVEQYVIDNFYFTIYANTIRVYFITNNKNSKSLVMPRYEFNNTQELIQKYQMYTIFG